MHRQMVILFVVIVISCVSSNPLIDNEESRVMDKSLKTVSRQYLPPKATLLASVPFARHLIATVALVFKWFWVNSSLIILGAVSMVGLCTLTPFCAISFTKFETLPNLPEGYYRSLEESTFLEQAQNLFNMAIDKYQELQTPESNNL